LVKTSPLSEIGTEMWRRFLRRNRSIISNIAMGQVLNRVTCPVCNHTSVNFDPFSILSMPIPTAVDIVFRCNIIRRSTAINCPQTLGMMNRAMRSDERVASLKEHLVEEYYIQMSRLSNICDLKVKLQKLSGIDAGFLRLYSVDGSVTDLNSIDQENIKLRFLQTEKAEPISSAVAQHLATVPHLPVLIIAYEPTLSRRQFFDKIGGNVTDEQDGGRQHKEVTRGYGDDMECRFFDTDPLVSSKCMSRTLWPTSMSQIILGLRVDAMDQKKQWYPGSVVDVSKDESTMQPIVKVHFDNFQPKWDLAYSIEDFKRENIKPLYSATAPKKPLEFEVEHCHGPESSICFGLPYQLQCYHEWTMARAGAHILSQAARFTETSSDELKSDKVALDLAENGRRIISKIVDILVDADRRYIQTALSIESSDRNATGTSKDAHRQRQTALQNISVTLKEDLKDLLPRLPFEICVRDIPMNQEAPESTKGKPFLFLLDRVIGNFVNLRQKAILQWKEPIQNTVPPRFIHKESRHVLDQFMSEQKALKESNHNQGGMRLGICLDEFCKEQQLKDAGWRCPKCKEEREGKQSMGLWRMPDVLMLHLKRFNCSAQWREKIKTRVNFPLTGLNMKKWCDKDSPHHYGSDANFVYDLIGVINHYGGMTGGHYVSLCKATACSPAGSEEVEHNFNGAGVYAFGEKDKDGAPSSGWKLRNKEKEATKLQYRAAIAASKSATESSEPLWLQFDDHSVEAIPPSCVVSDSAYVLFYRRRRISPSNIARYSTMV